MACREGQDPDAPAVQYPLLRAVQRLRSAREGGRVPQAQTHNTDMADAMLSMQMAYPLHDEPLPPQWDAELPELTLDGKQHSPSSGVGETDFLRLAWDQEFMTEEVPGLPSFPADDLSFLKADDTFCTQTLDDHGIDIQLPHSDTLTHDSQLRGLASVQQSAIRVEQRMLPPIAIRQQRPQPHHVPEMDFARHHREQRTSEARVRPHTALPAVQIGHMSNAMHMPCIPERPNNMHRTRSCPSNGYNYPLPTHFANGASPHEAQSYRPPSFHSGRACEPEYRHGEILHEEDPVSPPRRKGKGGRQRAPAPDASVDPKRAKRIMANRASAAKSKEKQKQKVMELEDKRDIKNAVIKAMQDAIAKRKADCQVLQDKLAKLNHLEQEYDRLKTLNKKLAEFHRVLNDALSASDGASWINSQQHCLPQAAYGEAPVNVHAFSANSMLGGPPAFQGTPSGPHTPNGDMYAGRLPQLSDLSDQVLCEGSTSPPDLCLGSGHSRQ